MRFRFPPSFFAGLLLAIFPFSAAYAQNVAIEWEKPAELWSTTGGDYAQYTSVEELIGAVNSNNQYDFNRCTAHGPPYSCSKVTFGGIRPDQSFPLKINGNYIHFAVNASFYFISVDANGRATSYTRDASNNYGIDRGLQCRQNTIATSETLGSNERRQTCIILGPPPPLPCHCGGAPGSVGNPIQIVTGTKTEFETDYATADGVLSVTREFLGQDVGWRMAGGIRTADLYSQDQAPSSYTQQLNVVRFDSGNKVNRQITLEFPYTRASSTSSDFRVLNSDGSQTIFSIGADGKSAVNMDGSQVVHLSSPTPEGAIWRRIGSDDTIEEYDTNGHRKKRQLRNGVSVIYQYDGNGRLTQAQDSWGRQLSYRYDSNGNVDQITLPDGHVVMYAYNNGLLSQVTYADGTSRQFLYNEPNYVVSSSQPPYALTGIIDENGVRFGTYQYDSARRAVSTEHAGGVDKYALYFGGSFTNVTSPVGGLYRYYFSIVNGRSVLSNKYQPAGAGSSAASNNFTYDANGNIASRTDFNGNKVCFAYDLTRNLETARVEGLTSSATCSMMLSATSLTAPARKISTQWHPTYHLPALIAEPKKLTTFTYDSSGNLLSKKEQATTDATGSQGFAAAVAGTPRTWSWTYNSVGQVLTATGPRTDVLDQTTYTYDDHGNLTSVTNAAGLVTTLSNYDADGRVGHIVDPNGVTTDLTYSPRGWLTQRSVSDGTRSETTGYTYDGVGQLIQASLPDTTLTYTYDPAHRLTDITDALGNTIHYTLDAMGNHTNEQVKGSSGTLARQVARVYDALNRLQQVTGGVQ